MSRNLIFALGEASLRAGALNDEHSSLRRILAEMQHRLLVGVSSHAINAAPL
jgi:hypothetical protein